MGKTQKSKKRRGIQRVFRWSRGSEARRKGKGKEERPSIGLGQAHLVSGGSVSVTTGLWKREEETARRVV